MHKYLLLPVFILFSLVATSHEKDSLTSSQLRFVENKGQWDGQIKYKTDLDEGYLQCLPNRLQFVFRDQAKYYRLLTNKLRLHNHHAVIDPSEFIINYHAYSASFINCNKDVEIQASGCGSDYANYYLGNDKSKWRSNIHNYSKIAYVNLYNNIDMELFEENHLLKYQFLIHKGANPNKIVIGYEGVNDISIQHHNLIIKTSVNQVTELAPVAFQMINGSKKEVPCRYALHKNRVSFEFPEGYDKEYDLVIDPILIFSTYTGSLADNWGFTATYDDYGYTYSGGICFNDISNGYPVSPGAFQVNFAGGEGTYYGGCDVAIIKYDTTGHNRVYATYLGGSRNDLPHSIIVDKNNNLLVFGTTGSSDFPMAGAPNDPIFSGGTDITYDWVLTFNLGVDMYVAKLNQAGNQLLASTFLGGSLNDGINFYAPLSHNYADGARGEIDIDDNNNVYIVSTTASHDFPITPNAFQTTYGGDTLDGCITVLDNNLHNIIWSSYLGGSGLDAVYGVVIDDSMNIYVCGGTTSLNFPTTPGAYQTVYNGGSADGFVTQIAPNGNAIAASTYYGSAYYDQTYLMDRNKQGYIFVFGQTADPGNTYIQNALWNHPGGGQYVTKFYPDLSSRYWSTAFGTGNGGPDISPTAFLVDLCSKIYLSGWGGSLNSTGGTSGLPISGNAFQNTTDNNDFYLLVIRDDASGMEYGTYFGGPSSAEHVDGGTSRFDRKGKIYQSVCAGCGGFDDFPTTPGAWSNANNSVNCNNGTFKFDFILPVTIADFHLPPVICLPDSVHFINNSYSGGSGMDYLWNFGDGQFSTYENPVHYYTQSGLYTVTLVASDTGSCNFADTISKQILVLSNSSDTLPTKHICAGDFTQIGVLTSGDSTVTYNWLPSIYLSDPHSCNPIAHPPATITYTLLVSNGTCTDTLRQTVEIFMLDAIPSVDTATCDGHIVLTANSGQGANYFHWSSNHNFTDWLNTSSSDPHMSANITTPSYFYVEVSNGYCTVRDSIFVSFVVVLDSLNFVSPTCHDSCNGIVSVTINSGSPPFSYLWSNGITTATNSGLCAGTYSVTVTDASQCISVSSVTLTEPDELTTSVQLQNIPCDEACIGSIALVPAGGTPPYSYIWNNYQTTNPLENLCAGYYDVTITDSRLCQLSNAFSIVIDSVFAHVQVYSDKDTIYQGQSTGLHATQIPNCTYTWTPTTGLDNPYQPNPVASPGETTTYYLTIADPYGCIYTDTLKIIVLEVFCDEPYIYVPNAFTPNGDGKNDILFVRSKMISEFNFLVYDRWGEKVFETQDINKGWDGKFKGKICDPGVFVYYLDAWCHNKLQYSKKGNVTLIR
ncbi:MAG TPA: gliding motility-associated C-terminal domain-containing protein [Bacteroidales bacterium]|nr:gliding motility-associated C-terminal domain-containing protein [Bacteroidales bacterium]